MLTDSGSAAPTRGHTGLGNWQPVETFCCGTYGFSMQLPQCHGVPLTVCKSFPCPGRGSMDSFIGPLASVVNPLSFSFPMWLASVVVKAHSFLGGRAESFLLLQEVVLQAADLGFQLG